MAGICINYVCVVELETAKEISSYGSDIQISEKMR